MISQDTLSRTLAAILASVLAAPSQSFAWGGSSASSSGHSAPAHTSGHSVTAKPGKPSHLRHWPTTPKQ